MYPWPSLCMPEFAYVHREQRGPTHVKHCLGIKVNPKASPIALSTHRTGRVSGKVQFISLRFTIAYLVQDVFASSAPKIPLQRLSRLTRIPQNSLGPHFDFMMVGKLLMRVKIILLGSIHLHKERENHAMHQLPNPQKK